MRKFQIALVFSLLSLLQFGCPKAPTGEIHEAMAPDYDRPLPPGQLALRKLTDPRDIPDFTPALADTTNLRQAIARSLDYLAKPSSRQFFPYGSITHDQAVASLKAFDAMLASGRSPAELNAAIRQQFDVYSSVGWNGKGGVLFTGYYTPIFDASPVRTERFKYPLYKQPADLVKAEDGRTVGRRVAAGQVQPYPTRKDIESSGMLAGNELVYLGDPFEVYIAHVQGSARLRMPDSSLITVGYTANNGYDYNSIAREMVKEGKIPAENLSLQAMIDYFKAHPDQIKQYTWRNPRFVFFAPSNEGPSGCLNEPVTAMRSIATDKGIFPRASLAFISTDLPRRSSGAVRNSPYRGFALDQDAGGAIRAAGRCDIYMGVGPQAGELAGRTQNEGRLYYLFLKQAPAVPPSLTPAPAVGQTQASAQAPAAPAR